VATEVAALLTDFPTVELYRFDLSEFDSNAESESESDLTFFEAIKQGRLNQLRTLIAKGADINQKFEIDLHNTPLRLAVHYEQKRIVEELLQQGADIEQSSCQEALESYNPRILAAFLRRGADFSGVSESGYTLHASRDTDSLVVQYSKSPTKLSGTIIYEPVVFQTMMEIINGLKYSQQTRHLAALQYFDDCPKRSQSSVL
jgi:hypothetical protein